MKTQLALILGLAFGSLSAQAQRGPIPNLTEAQKTCLENKLGKPGEGDRPSREVADAAFSACGIERPQHSPGMHRPELTDEQKSCLESRIGKPDEGRRPTREQMASAFQDCGIQAPRERNQQTSSDTSTYRIPARSMSTAQ